MSHTIVRNTCDTGKSLVLLLVFCVIMPLSGSAQKFFPEYNRKKPLTLNQKDTTLFFSTMEEKVGRLREDRFYHYYFHGKVLQSQGAYLGHLLDGEFIRLDGKEVLAEQGFFKNGLKHGDWKTWYSKGELKSQQVWRNGKPGKVRFEYGRDGQKQKYVFKKEQWVLKSKLEKGSKKKPDKNKKKLGLWKRKREHRLVVDSIPVKVVPLSVKTRKEKAAPEPAVETEEHESTIENESQKEVRDSETPTQTDFLRENMTAYEQAKSKVAKSKKDKRLKSPPARKTKVVEVNEAPKGAKFFQRLWNKFKKNKPETDEKNKTN